MYLYMKSDWHQSAQVESNGWANVGVTFCHEDRRWTNTGNFYVKIHVVNTNFENWLQIGWPISTNFKTWLLIGWQLCCQPIISHVWKISFGAHRLGSLLVEFKTDMMTVTYINYLNAVRTMTEWKPFDFSFYLQLYTYTNIPQLYN